MMDLLGCLPNQEHPASDQDHVAPRKTLAENAENRRGQLDDDSNCAEPQDKGRPDTDLPGTFALMLGQAVVRIA